MTDAHCHPWNLLEFIADAEDERRQTKTAVAASSWNLEQFEYHEKLALKAEEENAPKVFCCFALHPQLSAQNKACEDFSLDSGYEHLQLLAAAGRLDAVGESGFDLYDEQYKAAEKLQDEMFARHLEIALNYKLPLVLHVRRSMHKIFSSSRKLKKLPAVIFHSWSGTRSEGEALLKRGINAYFSFGAAVTNNHRAAIDCAVWLPQDRILLETDAPYQPLRGKVFSSWRDLPQICASIALFRKVAGSTCADSAELKALTTENFFKAFS
jgi:TatD DNase family protein